MHDEWEDEYGEVEYVYVERPGPFRTQCAFCKGTGVDPATMGMLAHESCPACKGLGIQEFKGSRSSYIQCTRCGGSGKDPGSQTIKRCSVCCGFGIV